MPAQSVGILPNNEVALFCVPCYTIGMSSSVGGMDRRANIWIYHNEWTTSKAKTTPKPIII